MRIIVKHRHAWISLEEFDSISTKISKMSSQWWLFLRFTFNYKSLKEEVTRHQFMIQFIMFNVSSSIYFLKVDQCGIFTHLETEIFEVCLRTFSPTRTSLSSSPMINVTKSNQKFNHTHKIYWSYEWKKWTK